MSAVVASAMAGAASGARSFTGIGAVALTADPNGSKVDRVLARPAARYSIAALAVSEYVADKLPMTPSRLEVPGLITRVLGAAASGAVLAQRVQPETSAPNDPVEVVRGEDGPARVSIGQTLACVGAAVAASATTAFGGVHGRAWLRHRVHYDFIPAVIEDAAALGLAAAATS